MSRFKGQAVIRFPEIAAYIDKIAHSLTAHNMALSQVSGGYDLISTFGTVSVRPAQKELHLTVEASDAASFNRLKHDLTGLIDFQAREEALEITWTGDVIGNVLPPDLRVLTVRTIEDLGRRWRRITFEGADLGRYDNPGQIHCRLLFQAKGVATPEWPQMDDHGRIVWPAVGKLSSRIFTIRAIDVEAGRLVIDFVLHKGEGPAIGWVRAAAPGDIVGILGPAAHGREPADCYLFAGDETGLPGIARILEDLPATAIGVAFIEVGSPEDQLPLRHPAGIAIRWLHRGAAPPGTTTLLADAVRGHPLAEGIFCWVGTEFASYRDIHTYLRRSSIPRVRQVAFSHWRKGMSEEDIVEVGASSVSA